MKRRDADMSWDELTQEVYERLGDKFPCPSYLEGDEEGIQLCDVHEILTILFEIVTSHVSPTYLSFVLVRAYHAELERRAKATCSPTGTTL